MPNRFTKVGAQQVPLLGGNAKMASDPKRNQTVLHLSTLGAIRGEQNNTFVDDSPNRYTITRTGNVAPSTFSPYGDSWSNYFDGNGDYLTVADNAALEFGSGDFTIEAWIYLTAAPAKATSVNEWSSCICAKDSNTLSRGFEFRTYGNATSHTGLAFFNFYNSVDSQLINTNFNFQLNTWYHVAVSKSGTTARMFINGSLLATATFSQAQQDSTAPVYIGWAGYAAYDFYFPGNISNLRIVKGTALYTANFTPSKTPLTAVSGTSLLTCASNRFQDKSSNNFAITPAGNVAVKTASPFPQTREFRKPQRGWCVPFNGSTQRLETPAASVANGLQLGTSDFTIECWVKAKPQSNYARVMDSGDDGNSTNVTWFIAHQSAATDTSTVYMRVRNGADNSTAEITLPGAFNNAWNHIAFVRISNTIYGYLNGILVSNAPLTSTIQNFSAANPISIGVGKNSTTSAYSRWFSGKISNVMIVKKALYSGNFVPMQSPRTADQNGTLPVLLTCQGSSIYDYSYSSQTLTSAGSLVVDSDGPFDQDDELSYYFDGNGDYLSIADNAALELGSGDFTIEAWINPTAYSTYDGSRYTSTIAAKENSYYIQINGTTASNFTSISFSGYNGTTYIEQTSNFSFNLNTWYHVVATRQSGTLNLFVNGALLNSFASYTHTLQNNANALMVGSTMGITRNFTGYISNFRLVTGAALYTANFTPSRKPLGIASSGSTALLTCKGRTAADQSNNNLTVTVFGTAGTTANPVSRKSPFNQDERYGMSYYFDGNGDYLYANLPVITPLAFGTGDFTIEGWIYPLATGSTHTLFDLRSTTTTGGPLLQVQSNGSFTILNGGTTLGTSATGIYTANRWSHYAISRSGTSLKVFLNGDVIINITNSTNFTTATTRPFLGSAINNGAYFYGYMSGISVQKGVAKYTAAFTPPSSPQLIGDYSQSLLLNAYPAIYDTTRKNAIETLGSYAGANLGSPGSQRAERYSHYFGGSTAGDYLSIPNSPDFDFGTGDFTIETWVYIAGNSVADGSGNRVAHIVGAYNNAGQGWYFSVWGNSTTTGNGLGLEVQNSGVYASSVPGCTISQSAWHHIAMTRKDGTLRFFLNGTKQGSDVTFTNSLNSGGSALRIGRLNATSYDRYLFGALHDLRVTKGIARYISSFTMPFLHPIK